MSAPTANTPTPASAPTPTPSPESSTLTTTTSSFPVSVQSTLDDNDQHEQEQHQLEHSSSPSNQLFCNLIDTPLISQRRRRQHHQQQSGLFLVGLIGMLALATILTVLFVPRDEHSPRMLMHPLTSIRNSQPQEQDGDSVRYLTFGSSSTWGEGLQQPKQQGYPWLLSSTVHNVAARVGSGISLSAICTQSIVGDGRYDVVVIEFMDHDAEGVVQLAHRIRQRFPNAKLVFVRLWSPATHVLYDDELPLMEWWKHQPKNKEQQQVTLPPSSAEQQQPEEEETIASSSSSPSLLTSFEFQAALLNSDPKRWSFVDYSQQMSVINNAISEVNGMLYELPSPASGSSSSSNQPTIIPLSLTSPTYTALFQDDRPSLLSSTGHQMVAHGIQQLIAEAAAATITTPLQQRNQVGSWGTGDACSLWYGTGDYSALRSRRRASLVDFAKTNDGFHKHAVEISRRGGSIEVTNPFSEPRMLYLTYMTAPAGSSGNAREYPRTKVSLGPKASVMIDPIYNPQENNNNNSNQIGDSYEEDHHHDDDHVTRTTAVGLVQPGRTVVKLNSLDEDSINRFRLVGHHFLAKGRVPVPFEFDLEPDAAHR